MICIFLWGTKYSQVIILDVDSTLVINWLTLYGFLAPNLASLIFFIAGPSWLESEPSFNTPFFERLTKQQTKGTNLKNTVNVQILYIYVLGGGVVLLFCSIVLLRSILLTLLYLITQLQCTNPYINLIPKKKSLY